MSAFHFGALADWSVVPADSELRFATDGQRRVSFDLFMVDEGLAEVVSGDVAFPVALGRGMHEVSFTVSADAVLSVTSDGLVLIRTRDNPQVVAESVEASYTTIEPRGPRKSDDVLRVERLMQINQQRREAVLMGAIEALQAQVNAVAAQAAAQVVEPALEPGASSDG